MKKMTKEDIDFCERTAKYEVVSEEINEDGYKIAVLRTYNGATVICRIPPETPEQRKEKAAKICRALTEFAHPDCDFSECSFMQITF